MAGLGALVARETRVAESREHLRPLVAAAKAVYGLGASTKGNELLQRCSLTQNDIAGIGEVNDDKAGSFMPGSLIPIVDETEVLGGASLTTSWSCRLEL